MSGQKQARPSRGPATYDRPLQVLMWLPMIGSSHTAQYVSYGSSLCGARSYAGAVPTWASAFQVPGSGSAGGDMPYMQANASAATRETQSVHTVAPAPVALPS